MIAYRRISIEEARSIVSSAGSVVSYIGHEPTARLLTQLLGVEVAVSRAAYVPSEGDVALVFRLRQRLQAPATEKGDVRPEDLEVLLVKYLQL